MVFQTTLIGHGRIYLILPEKVFDLESLWLDWLFEVKKFVQGAIFKTT